VVRTPPQEIGPDENGGWYLPGGNADQDPVRSLHDTEEEAGEEVGVTDTYSLDTAEARQMHVDLDSTGGQEPELD
jgi:hypothetical protein